MAKLSKDGKEILDQTPVAIPVGITRPPTLQEQIQRLISNETIKAQLAAQGQETFDEADDFEVGEDYDPQSPYETIFDPETNREMYKPEKAFLDKQRADFDEHLRQKKIKAAKAKKLAADKAPVKEANYEIESEEHLPRSVPVARTTNSKKTPR